jgi:hypothetical protein
MRKLVELLDTVYIAEHFAQDVATILEEHKELDLAGARLTPRISSMLLDSMRSGVVLRNTESIELDTVLQENMARLKLQYQPQSLPMLKRRGEEAILEYLRALEEGVVYKVHGENSLLFPVAVLIQIYRPSIQLDFEHNTSRFFRYITETMYRKNFEKVIQTTDNFILFVGESFQEVTITEKDMGTEFFVESAGNVDWYKLISTYYILPSYFGAVKVMKDETLAPLWEPVISKAIADIDSHFLNRKMTIKDFLKGDTE